MSTLSDWEYKVMFVGRPAHGGGHTHHDDAYLESLLNELGPDCWELIACEPLGLGGWRLILKRPRMRN